MGLRRALVACAGSLTLALTAAGGPASAGAAQSEGRMPPASGSSSSAGSTAAAADGRFTRTSSHRIGGSLRFEGTVTAVAGGYRPAPSRLSYQWLRDGRVIAGGSSRTYRVGASDVGRRLQVRVTAQRSGYAPSTTLSPRSAVVGHAVPLRRTATYEVVSDGPVRADLAQFARQAQQSFSDPRGWRAGGTGFRRVARGTGADFTLVLATPDRLRSYSSVCSPDWSCRVGRYVVINEKRWQQASPAWNAAGGSLRNYRHMVVNHETGHWLGNGHVGCGGKGWRAPVMMQQSKDLGGCRFNPWPLPGER